jgi:serine/threonine-protein kinase HipA
MMPPAAGLVLEVLLGNDLAGWLFHWPESNRFAFNYAPSWLAAPQPYPLSPGLPLHFPANLAIELPEQSAEMHSASVRQFFENLLPEGRALDEAASANNLSKSNLIGLMLALGGETSGAIRMRLAMELSERAAVPTRTPTLRRALLPTELSTRIRARPYQAFSVWDGKVRLSIAGFQDKIAVFKEGDDWFFVEGSELASTVILKPEPSNPALAGIASNEFFCMTLARAIGLPVAQVALHHVPERVLEVLRFDRRQQVQRPQHPQRPQQIQRLHVFDGCQALGISAMLKYERPYGDNEHVRHIRDGASLPRLFDLLESSKSPAAQRLQLLRWVLFQVLIGNTDAHAKNLSFFCDANGFYLTPAYDLVCTLACGNAGITDAFAMAIGDAFQAHEFSCFEWAHFAFACQLRPALVAQEMKKMIAKIKAALAECCAGAQSAGADMAVVDEVCKVVQGMCERHERFVAQIAKVDQRLF